MLLNFDDERLTARQKRRLRNIAASWTVENMPPTNVNIDRMVRLTLGLITPEEATAEVDAQVHKNQAKQQES
ncbi:MAG: antitoxin VbhA family protein [Corynebacterium sp.]|nr:antitoxin VbhA family protein [Corynebacterium sp.]